MAAFNSAAVERAVLSLKALLGLGAWSLLPLLVAVLLAALLLFSVRLPLQVATPTAQPSGAQARVPSRFWVFAALAALYGIVERMNGKLGHAAPFR